MSNNAVFLNAGPTTVTVGDGLTGTGDLGDPLVVQVDGTTIEATGGALNVVPDLTLTSLQADTYKSSDGTSGAVGGTFTALTSITVKDGIVTAISGT